MSQQQPDKDSGAEGQLQHMDGCRCCLNCMIAQYVPTKASGSQGCDPAVLHRGWRQAVLSPCEQLQAVVNVLTSKAHCEGLAAITCAWHIKSHCGHHHAVGQNRQSRQLAWIKCNLVTHDLPVPAGHRGTKCQHVLKVSKGLAGLRVHGMQAILLAHRRVR